MKRMMYPLLVLLVSCSANAQKMDEKEVPAAVKSACAKSYPGAEKVKWEKEGTDYEAEFEQNEVEMSVVFSPDGKMLEEEKEIAISTLPETVKKYVKTNYPDQKIKEATIIRKADGTQSYEVELKDLDLFFSENGTFLNSKKD